MPAHYTWKVPKKINTLFDAQLSYDTICKAGIPNCKEFAKNYWKIKVRTMLDKIQKLFISFTFYSVLLKAVLFEKLQPLVELLSRNS